MKNVLTLLFVLFSVFSWSQWNLIWSDEFNGTALDDTKWTNDIGGWGWGNNELQYYTNGDNLLFTGSELQIEARDESFGGNSYTSGKIISKDKFEVQYGKIEARIRIPMGQGLWPAFWMLGANFYEIGWPFCGEIDVMEHINNEMQIHGTMHWDDGGHVFYGGSTGTDPSVFHDYAIEWDASEIRWYLDGVQYHVASIENGVNGTSEFHEPFYLILNLAVGGNWPGSPNGSTPFPSTLDIDYVRVYKSELQIITEVCEPASEVRLTGPWWGWDPAGGPVAADNGDGTWTFTFNPPPTENMEYLLVVDGVQENLIQEMIDGGTCAPITDYFSYANRLWETTDPYLVYNTYGQCEVCNPPDPLVITVEVCDPAGVNEVRLTGPWWGWDPNSGLIGSDNGDGTWSFTFAQPESNFEYLFLVDGVQENLVADMQNGGDCAPVTDYWNYANRLWSPGDPLNVFNTYGTCGICDPPALVVIAEVCAPVNEVRMTGPDWGWDPNGGPVAVDNGDGTWTFTIDPGPAADLEYLLVVNGVQESLIDDVVVGGGCAPVTDNLTYAHRLWVTSDDNPAYVTYGQCVTCDGFNACQGDFNNDAIVNTTDLLNFLSFYGANCE